MNILKTLVSFFLDFVETLVTAAVIFVLFYIFLFQPHQVKGNSMLPSFHDGENLLTNKITYRFKKPLRGDVITFKAPQNQNYDYIKRIIGLPGEKIKIVESQIYINNSLYSESSYLPEDVYTSSGNFIGENEEITVPQNQYFVLGDNRSHSSDSREWGFIPTKNIIGKAWLRYWPFSKLGFIPTIPS